MAEDLYKSGLRAERAGDTLQAYILYARAAALEPNNLDYQTRAAALRSIAEFDAKGDPKTEVDAKPAAVKPPVTPPEPRTVLPPITLAAKPDRKDFDLKGNPQTVVEKVAEAYGLEVVFEADYRAVQAFTFRMNDVDYREALRALEMVTDSFMVPVNEHLLLVARDTAQRRTALAPDAAVEIPIPQRMSLQDAQEILATVQQTLDVRHMGVDALRHTVFLRDQVSKVNAARELFASLALPRPQVELEVELVSVDKNSSLGYGLSLPNSFPLVNFSSFLHNSPSIPSGFSSFLTFGGGATFVGIGITEASAFATVSKASAVSLLRAQVTSIDGQPATLHVGERYPIITNQYVGNTAGTTGQIYAPPPTVNFQDLGLVLKVTPEIHGVDEVTLDLETEFSELGAASNVNGIPIISSQKFNGKVTLMNGQWAVMAGLIQVTASDTKTGIAGLSDIPLIGRLFSQNQINKDNSEVLLVLKPHLVSLPPSENVTPPILVGSETRPVSAF